MTKYIGWIPNVAGRLSFSHIGQTRHPSRCRTLNEDDGGQRLIICKQHRVLSDALIRPRYFRFVYGYDPAWIFVLVASSVAEGEDKRAALVGKIYVFNRTRWKQSAGGVRSGSEIVDELYSAAEVATDRLSICPQFLNELKPVLCAELESRAVYVASCEIRRNGECIVGEELRTDGVMFASSVVEEARPIDERATRYFCNQAFFFAKDVTHEHRHHHPRADTITSAYAEDSQKSWIRETQYSIHRRVVSVRRSQRALSAYDAMGMMAYMKSFKQVIAQFPESEGKSLAEQYNLPETEDSLKARLEKKKWVRVQMNLILAGIPAITIGLMSVLGQKTSDLSPTVFSWLKGLLVGVFTPDLKGFIAAGIALICLPLIYGAIDPTKFESVLNAKRMTLIWDSKRQAAMWYALAAIVTAFGAAAVFLRSRGSISSDVIWLGVFGSIVFCSAVFVLLPYMFTVPDLIVRLRNYPHYPDKTRA